MSADETPHTRPPGKHDPHITVIQDELFAPGRSKAARYAELVIGRSSFWALAKYELIVTSCAKVVRVS